MVICYVTPLSHAPDNSSMHDYDTTPDIYTIRCAEHMYKKITSRIRAQSIPTYLNHNGRQSSRLSQFSPSVKRPATQPEHLGLFGQLKKGMC